MILRICSAEYYSDLMLPRGSVDRFLLWSSAEYYDDLTLPRGSIPLCGASVAVVKYLDYLRRINCHPARRLNEAMPEASSIEDNDAGGNLGK